MRSSLPKMLHPVCGRPMVAWPIHAAREAGAGRVAVDRLSAARSLGGPAGGCRDGRPARAGRDRWRAAGRDRVDPRVRDGRRPLRRSSRRLLRGDLGPARGPSRRRRRGDGDDRVLEDPGSYGRIVRDADGDLERIVETKEPGDATPERARDQGGQHRHLRVRRSAAGRRAGADRQRQLPGRVLPRRRPAADARSRTAGRRHLTEDEAVSLGVNTRADLALAEAESPPRASSRRHMLAGVTIVDPGLDLGRRRRRDRGRRPDRARHLLRGPQRGRRRLRSSARSATLIDTGLGRGVAVPHSYLVECEVLDGCPVGPFAYLRPGDAPRGRRQGRLVRRDQELRDRRGYQGPAPLLHRRRRRRRGTNLGAGTDHRQLRRFPQAPHGDRRPRPHRRRHDRSSPR